MLTDGLSRLSSGQPGRREAIELRLELSSTGGGSTSKATDSTQLTFGELSYVAVRKNSERSDEVIHLVRLPDADSWAIVAAGRVLSNDDEPSVRG